jgi:hypothetical protein
VSSTTRIRQTKHIKAVAEAATRAEVSVEALEAVVTLGTITASVEAEAETKATVDITYCLHVKRNTIYITNQVTSRQSIALINKKKNIKDLANVANTPRLRTTKVSSAKSRASRAL